MIAPLGSNLPLNAPAAATPRQPNRWRNIAAPIEVGSRWPGCASRNYRRRQEFKRQEKARPQRPGFFIVEVSDRERISARPA
ncbi:hypothetical protein [Bradyrhizobium sp. AZCC 1693]|uniref:hypothetical protein n=1 Tax=Bradyrhizobium sp. AZCC 1693 TaxID=3117029 RepID=UPI002FF0ED36